MNQHYLVCGFGKNGRAICEQLVKHELPFIVLENDPKQLNELQKLQYPFLEGDAADDRLLEQAKIKKAKGLLALLGDDAQNVFLVLPARQLQANLNCFMGFIS